MFSSDTKVRVRYAETDQMGVVYHSNFFLYYEVARAESIRDMGYTYADMEKMGVIMPVVEVQSRFLRPALYDDLLTIKTMIRELPVNHRIEFHQEVYNELGKLLSIGRVVLYFIKASDKSKTVIPDNMRERLIPFFEKKQE